MPALSLLKKTMSKFANSNNLGLFTEIEYRHYDGSIELVRAVASSFDKSYRDRDDYYKAYRFKGVFLTKHPKRTGDIIIYEGIELQVDNFTSTIVGSYHIEAITPETARSRRESFTGSKLFRGR